MSKREFLERLGNVWEKCASNWTFEQIMCNVFGLPNDEDFYADDETTISFIEDYFKDMMEDLEKKGK